MVLLRLINYRIIFRSVFVQTLDSVSVVTTVGKTINCRRVILAIPPHLAGKPIAIATASEWLIVNAIRLS